MSLSLLNKNRLLPIYAKLINQNSLLFSSVQSIIIEFFAYYHIYQLYLDKKVILKIISSCFQYLIFGLVIIKFIIYTSKLIFSYL